jgi:molecular chaperone DnaK
MNASMKLGEAIYKEAQAEQAQAQSGAEQAQANAKDEKVVDAEFEEVKEDEKK